MFRLLETIRMFNGIAQDLPYHQTRMQKALRDQFNCNETIELDNLIKCNDVLAGLTKCRISYDATSFFIDFTPYQFKKVNKFKLVLDNNINYHHKFEDRSKLDGLYNNREDCQDIIIVKEGNLTDSYYANLVFRKNGKILTPSKPLLRGTKRQKYMDLGIIEEAIIDLENYQDYDDFQRINAMMDIEEDNWMSIKKII